MCTCKQCKPPPMVTTWQSCTVLHPLALLPPSLPRWATCRRTARSTPSAERAAPPPRGGRRAPARTALRRPLSVALCLRGGEARLGRPRLFAMHFGLGEGPGGGRAGELWALGLGARLRRMQTLKQHRPPPRRYPAGAPGARCVCVCVCVCGGGGSSLIDQTEVARASVGRWAGGTPPPVGRGVATAGPAWRAVTGHERGALSPCPSRQLPPSWHPIMHSPHVAATGLAGVGQRWWRRPRASRTEGPVPGAHGSLMCSSRWRPC